MKSKTIKPGNNPPAPVVNATNSTSPVAKTEVVLLVVTGMTPAVLTETVWALAHEQPPVIPDRVVVITTTLGNKRMEQELLTPVSPGQDDLWQSLRSQIFSRDQHSDRRLNLDLPRLISARNARTGRSEALEDFRTSAENAATADFLLEQVRGFVGLEDKPAATLGELVPGQKVGGGPLQSHQVSGQMSRPALVTTDE